MVDRVGEEFKWNLPYIVGELNRILESLLLAKDPLSQSQSSLPPPAADQATKLTLKCKGTGFLNAMNMVSYCQQLANKSPPPSGLTQLAASMTQCVQINLLSLEEKMTAALTMHAKSVSSSITEIPKDSDHPLTRPSFVQVVAQTADRARQAEIAQPPTLMRDLAPLLFPYITLSQTFKDKKKSLDGHRQHIPC